MTAECSGATAMVRCEALGNERRDQRIASNGLDCLEGVSFPRKEGATIYGTLNCWPGIDKADCQ